MVTVRRWRWERLLLVVLLALGVVAMHATPAITAGQPMAASMVQSPSAAMPGADQPGDEQPGHGPGAHHMLAPCLAILGTLVLLAVAVAVFNALRWRARDAGRMVATVVAVAPRPPPAHAVALAQLCVLRT